MQIILISKLKLEKLFKNAEKIDFIFDAMKYLMKLLNNVNLFETAYTDINNICCIVSE